MSSAASSKRGNKTNLILLKDGGGDSELKRTHGKSSQLISKRSRYGNGDARIQYVIGKNNYVTKASSPRLSSSGAVLCCANEER